MKKPRKIFGLDERYLKHLLPYLPTDSQAAFEAHDFSNPKLETDVKNAENIMVILGDGDLKAFPVFNSWNDFYFASRCAYVYKFLHFNDIAFEGSAEEFFNSLKVALNTLPEDSANSFLYYYGLEDGARHTYEETGKKYGNVTKSAIQKRISRVERVLRSKFKRELTHSKEFYSRKTTIKDEAREVGASLATQYINMLNVPIDSIEFSDEANSFFMKAGLNTLRQIFSKQLKSQLSFYNLSLPSNIEEEIITKKKEFIKEMFEI